MDGIEKILIQFRNQARKNEKLRIFLFLTPRVTSWIIRQESEDEERNKEYNYCVNEEFESKHYAISKIIFWGNKGIDSPFFYHISRFDIKKQTKRSGFQKIKEFVWNKILILSLSKLSLLFLGICGTLQEIFAPQKVRMREMRRFQFIATIQKNFNVELRVHNVKLF